MNISNEYRKVVGVVLAGGLSSRMGQDKALLQLSAVPMIMHTQKLLHCTSVDKVVVSRNGGCKDYYCDLIANKGPLSGIHTIATHFPAYDLLVLPVDLPLMDADSLETLLVNGKSSDKNVRFKNEMLPLFVRNTISFRQLINYTLLYTKRFSLQQLCANLPLVELPVTKPQTLFNTNTPEQWSRAMQNLANNNKQFLGDPL